jgi:hypothetical protein
MMVAMMFVAAHLEKPANLTDRVVEVEVGQAWSGHLEAGGWDVGR